MAAAVDATVDATVGAGIERWARTVSSGQRAFSFSLSTMAHWRTVQFVRGRAFTHNSNMVALLVEFAI